MSTKNAQRQRSRHPGLIDPNIGQVQQSIYALWPFEGNLLDSTGNGRHMTPTGTQIFVTGHNGTGQAVDFNGTSSSWATIPNFNLSTGTISVWVYVRGLGTQRVVRSTSSTICLGIHQGNWEACGAGGPAVVLNTWHHIAIVQGVGMYLNGVLAMTTGASQTAKANETTDIGRGPFGEPLNGSMDDMRWYNAVLSLSEVQYLASI